MDSIYIEKAKIINKGKSKTEKKRPPSAFLLFSKDVRKKISQACPYFSPLDVSKVISEQWKTLPETEKIRYREAASKLEAEENMKRGTKITITDSYIPTSTIQYIPQPQPSPLVTKKKEFEPIPSISSFGNLVTFKGLNYIQVNN